MNIKKLVVTAAAGAVMLSAVAVPAFARSYEGGWHYNQPSNTTTVVNRGNIKNTSVNVANTGLNQVNGGANNESYRHHDSQNNGGSITTGSAVAEQSTENGIYTTANGCGCDATGNNVTSATNTGNVHNLSVNVANTGLNQVNGNGTIGTGSAYAGQGVLNVVNTQVN